MLDFVNSRVQGNGKWEKNLKKQKEGKKRLYENKKEGRKVIVLDKIYQK